MRTSVSLFVLLAVGLCIASVAAVRQHHNGVGTLGRSPNCGAEVCAPLTERHYQTEFAHFVKHHNKKYTHEEFFHRFAIFKANYNKIRHHNSAKNPEFFMAVNAFTDLTFNEFHSKMTGYKPRARSHKSKKHHAKKNRHAPHAMLNSAELPDSLDWRAKGAVTPVKNQLGCGGCWSFSTTGSVEGATFIKTGKLISLSEQQLIDCSGPEGNGGCEGGDMDAAFQYIISNGGITTEAAYPFTAIDGTCNTAVTPAATLSSFQDVTPGSEQALIAAVNIGPVSIGIQANQTVFQFYSGGILSSTACGTALDHAVLVVGYGTDPSSNVDYWIVKNSWGPSWGENGYIRLARGQDECGLLLAPSYPIV